MSLLYGCSTDPQTHQIHVHPFKMCVRHQHVSLRRPACERTSNIPNTDQNRFFTAADICYMDIYKRINTQTSAAQKKGAVHIRTSPHRHIKPAQNRHQPSEPSGSLTLSLSLCGWFVLDAGDSDTVWAVCGQLSGQSVASVAYARSPRVCLFVLDARRHTSFKKRTVLCKLEMQFNLQIGFTDKRERARG